MKKILFLILVSLTFSFGYGQNENFDTAPDTPDGAGVWGLGSGNWLVRDNRTNGVPNWQTNIGTPYDANGGTGKAAYINRENTGAGVLAEEWLITPQFDLLANRQLRFFTTQTQTGNTGTIYQVRVSSDPSQSNLAAFTILATYTENELSTITASQTDYEEKIINLGITGPHYFAFVKVFTQPGNTLTGDRWLIDDFNIVERCADPTFLDAQDFTSYNATLLWTGSAPSYTIEYGLAGFDAGTGTIVTGLTGTSYTIPLVQNPPGPLVPDTCYEFYVTANCPTSNSLYTGPFTFCTDPLGSTCATPIVVTNPLPYFDNGNTLEQGNNISPPAPGANCGTTGDFMAGNDVVYAYTVPATTTGLISIDMNPLGITGTGVFVYANCADIGSNCIAGVANNNGNIRSIPALAVTAGSTIYIVISSTDNNPDFPYTLNIQDVNCTPPSGLSAIGTGPNSANLSWQNPGGAANWQVYVQNAGSTVPLVDGIPASVNTNFSVTQLTAEGTQLALGNPYQYWVRADCGDGTFSPWAGPYLFNTTSCSSGCNYTFELVDDFGDGWNGNTFSVIQDGSVIATLGPNFDDGESLTVSVPLCDGPFTLYWNIGGTAPWEVGLSIINSFGQVIFVQGFDEFSPDSQVFAGNVDCQNPLCLPPTQLTAYDETTNGVTVSWTPNGPPPASWDIYVVEVGSPAPDNLTTATVNTTQNPFTFTTQLDPDTEYIFYVRAVCSTPGENPWSDPSEPFTTLPTCPRPISLATSNADLTSITFDWQPGLSETAWEYIYVPANSPVPADNDPDWTPTTTHPVDIINLTQGTAYDFYVRAICEADDISNPAGPFTANTTVCPAVEQCIYTFTMIDDFGDGWNGNTMSILQNGIVVATIGADFEDGLGPIEVQIPLCHGVNFELFWNEEGNFAGEVGVSITSFLGQNIFTMSPGNDDGQGTTLFEGTGECSAPTCIAPSNVIVTSSNLTSATIQWTENNTTPSGSWDVLVLPSTAPAPAQNATGWINVNSNPFVYPGLTAATTYTVYVRSVCSDPDKSFWSIGEDFATQICEPANVCDYTFIMTDDFGDGWNGNTMSVLQNGILVATIGNEFTDGNGPIETVISLCNNLPFELFWNEGGNFPGEVGVAIENASGTQIFNMEFGESEPGTSLFSGTVNCVPATCPRPVQLNALNIGETSAELSWTEASSATTWEIIILPAGSPAPAPTDTGIITNDNPYTATLTSGTAYVFYVRAICSDTDHSNWAGPKAFNTLSVNDECGAAINVPVNPDQSCAQFVSGAIVGATASNLPNDCGGTADDDVWFEFTAVTSAHNINITHLGGSTEDLLHIVYQGDTCGTMTQLYCSDENESIATNLTPGGHYFIRIFSWTATPNQTTTFDICIGTIPPPIASSTTSHTPVQLIRDVLINNTCASVTNITSSTGSDFGTVNGIGYFNRNGSSFPFDYGVILTTGNADMAPGPNDDNMGEGTGEWPGDADLSSVLTAQGIAGTLGNATSIEFDFVPLTSSISFDFIFASEEYGIFQCQFSDVFGFFLTNTVTNVTTNLAVLPATDIPISVTTIRDGLYNENCGSANPQYFGSFFLPPGLPPLEAPIDFNGMTVPLTATSPVTPGVTYHIKLAIADFGPFGQDNVFDSAVFLKGGSFGLGNLELGDNLLEANGNAVCSGESVVINSTLNPADYTFIWSQGTQILDGQTGSTLTVTQEGQYTVQAQLNNSTCMATDSVVVEFYDPIVPGQANSLYLCNPQTTGVFNLTQNSSAILAPIGQNYTLYYYTNQLDATQNNTANAITAPETYTNTSNPQTIYITAVNNATSCRGVTTFQLILQDLTPQFTLPADFSICAGGSQTISVTPINFTLGEATYSWTLGGNPLPDTTSTITATAPGLYEVTVNRSGCTATLGVTVTVDAQITPTFNAIPALCQNTTAPVLPTLSNNSVTGTWAPATINTALAGTTNYCFTPNAGQTCAVQVCIAITIDPAVTPTFDPIGPLCSGSTPPVLQTTSNNGVAGIWNPAAISTAAPGTFTFDFTPGATQPCALPVTITVVVLPAGQVPVFDQIAPICSGEPLVLPTQSQNGINGTWTPAADNTLTTTYTFNPSNGQCAVTATMTVEVNESVDPDFELTGDCVGPQKVLSVKNNTFGSDVTYTWTDAQGEPIAGANGPTYVATAIGNYGLTVSLGNCSASQTIPVTSISCDLQRGISPGDGSKNDFFDLSGQGVGKLEIFNRYGTKVYSQVNYSKEWYGQTDKGDELPDGTYFYVIDYTSQPSKTGWIYINRVK